MHGMGINKRIKKNIYGMTTRVQNRDFIPPLMSDFYRFGVDGNGKERSVKSD